MGYTSEQMEAITFRDCDILVAAAAGSGKTAVLVERIISMITSKESPVNVNSLLVVTFTKASAGEMRGRIAEAISKKLESDTKNSHLQNQLIYLNRADIKTIHSFCLQVIKENIHLIDMDPSFRTADPSESKLLQKEVLEDIFEELYENQEDIDFFTLVETFGEDTKDDRLKGLVLDIYSFIQGCLLPFAWLDEMVEDYKIENNDLENIKWMPILRQGIVSEMQDAYKKLTQAKNCAISTIGFEDYQKNIEATLTTIDIFLSQDGQSFANMADNFKKISFDKLKGYKGEDIETAKKIQEYRDNAKKTIKYVEEKYFCYRPKTMLLHIQKLFTVVNALAQIVKLFSKRYQQAKKEKLLIDFSDYEHFCLQILTVQDEYGNFIPSLAAKAYQKKYKEILIDEYQDSNYIQETILSAVSKNSLGENNRFMVGDVKQSIYRFRLAMPEIFMEKYERYKVYENNKEKKIILSKNFRSRANVLAGVNFIFRQIMSKELGDILYDKDAELNWGLEFPESTENCGGENEILLLDTGDDLELEDSNYDYEEIEEMNRRELEALMIAKRIKTLMTSENFHVLDKETQKYRPVKFSDITILTRSVTSWAGVFEKIFKSEEIPFYAETARGYFETAEIMLVLNLLQIIDNPLQDIALIAVLYSPVCGFSANELMEIRLYSNEKTYYENIKLYLENMNEQKQSKEKNINIIKKLKEFLSKLDDWREKSITMSVSELLWYVYYDTGYFDYVGVTVGGNLRQGNLRVLIEKAQKYEETSRKGLFYFVRYIETVKDTNDLSSLAKLSNENENLIKIMTIHKSKGLEFPVVIVLDMGKKFNQEDTRAPLILHQKLGIGMNYLDLETRAKYQTLPRTALAEKIKEENLAEEIRVLYVAMTRAREKLILSGSIKNIERSVKNWISSSQTDIFTGFSLKKAKTYLDWLMPAFLRHETAKKFISEEFLEMEIENEFIKRAIKDDSLWSINIFKKSEFYEQKLDMKRRIEYGKDKFSLIDTKKDYSGHKNEIYEKLNFEYPYRQATKLPTKVSISEIKRRQLNISTSETQNTKLLIQPSIFEVPKFMLEKKELERAQIGTAVHMLMEELDFKKKYRVEEIKEEAMLMVSNGKLTEKEGQAISISSILAFFDTELSNRLQKSEYIKKEHSFAMTVSPMEIFPNENYDNVDELIVINGIIDCFFIEDGEIVLVDYKNDYIKNGEEDLLKKKYNLQLSFYKMALERGTGRKVKEVYIYSFMLKKAILMF